MPRRFFRCSHIAILLVGLLNTPHLQAQISDVLRSTLDTNAQQPRPIESDRQPSQTTLRSFYQARQFEAVWISNKALNADAETALAFLRSATEHGLRPEDYLPVWPTQAASSAMTEQQLGDLELSLSAALLHYLQDLRRGRVAPERIDPKWRFERTYEDVAALLNTAIDSPDLRFALNVLSPSNKAYRKLQQALKEWLKRPASPVNERIADGPLLKPGMQDVRVTSLRRRLTLPAKSNLKFDTALHAAVKIFQFEHGLETDGYVGPATLEVLNRNRDDVIASLRANLERQRWHDSAHEARYVLVNIPDFSLSLMENEKSVLQMRAIVGQQTRETPLLNSRINQVVFNPYWRVPHKIVVRDLLPKFQANPNYAREHGFELLNNWGGQPVSQTHIRWNTFSPDNFPYRVRQRPGPRNALGQVKFLFPNPYSVYIHDTSAPALFRNATRSYSSGCIRIEQPRELFTWLSRDGEAWTRNQNSPSWDISYKPSETVPVRIRYRTAWVDDNNTLQLRQDIYGIDKLVLAALGPLNGVNAPNR